MSMKSSTSLLAMVFSVLGSNVDTDSQILYALAYNSVCL